MEKQMKNYYTTATQLINEDVRKAYREFVDTVEQDEFFSSESNARLRVSLKSGQVYTTKLQNEIDRQILTEMLFAGKFRTKIKLDI